MLFFLLGIFVFCHTNYLLGEDKNSKEIKYGETIPDKMKEVHLTTDIKEEMKKNIWLNDVQIFPQKKKKTKIKKKNIESDRGKFQYLKVKSLKILFKVINSLNYGNKKIYKIALASGGFVVLILLLRRIYPGEKNVNKIIKRHCFNT